MNNRFVVLSALLILFGFTAPTFAQDAAVLKIENATKAKGKYAILASQDNHLMGGIMTGLKLKNESDQVQFQVVLAGPVVKNLTHDQDLINMVNQAAKANIPVLVCEIAMQKLGVSKNDLPQHIQVTTNAYLYMFGLQEKGFTALMP
ncbi:MAG TPA: DsrE family protein [Chitinophagaceae bacterium]|nr:DsrE family protein [Chitinophagaceae bacterium]